MAVTLMIQGTTSDAGKSLLVTALCRWARRRGVKVAPFKPQNMALNSIVTEDGGEIGRAQGVQARACGLEPHTDMNPILLKPNSDVGAQVIVHGRAIGNMDADTYHVYKIRARKAVLESYQRLGERFDAIFVEGAGSPAEINLRKNDIANMGFAEMVDCPVWLVADIHRGGVFAHLVGTLALLSPSERMRVEGFVINRFRGKPDLLRPGLEWLQAETGRQVFGVLPFLHGLHLEAEDALPTDRKSGGNGPVRIVVPVLPRISNHTDFDPLRMHPQVRFEFVGGGNPLPAADLIILPGTKNTRADLHWLRKQGWDSAILRHLRYGGKLIGICGGFQMLGRWIHDPHGIEGETGSSRGLNLLDMATTLQPHKQLRNTTGFLALGEKPPVCGYEIHAGITQGSALSRPAINLKDRDDGALSEDGQILGCYLHGLFESRRACDALLRWAGLPDPRTPDYAALRDASIERLADAVETHIETKSLERRLGL